MKNLVLSPPKFGFILATRAAGAFGIGLLVSGNLSNSLRRTLGKSLLALGILTTIPAVRFIFHGRTI